MPPMRMSVIYFPAGSPEQYAMIFAKGDWNRNSARFRFNLLLSKPGSENVRSIDGKRLQNGLSSERPSLRSNGAVDGAGFFVGKRTNHLAPFVGL